jgi:hypothetical protein
VGAATGPTSLKEMLPPMYVTAPHPQYCFPNFEGGPWSCYDDPMEQMFLGGATQPQIAQYCGDSYSGQFCNFYGGGGGPNDGFDFDNPTKNQPAMIEDIVLDPKPVCPASSSAATAVKAWCGGKTPETFNPEAVPRIEDALNRMRSISVNCAGLANMIDSVWHHDGLRLFLPSAYPVSANSHGGGFASSQGHSLDSAWVGISSEFITNSWSKSRKTTTLGQEAPMWLDRVLAHEADHLLGEPHLPGSQVFTTNTQECGG